MKNTFAVAITLLAVAFLTAPSASAFNYEDPKPPLSGHAATVFEIGCVVVVGLSVVITLAYHAVHGWRTKRRPRV